ncbi:T9SS type A sorting domain-containing protein [Carboxylicivirga sp. RSCT41]|uniref:T9SS type A sorting domain-containing protein n=1 Tax=Carboxylicivirga agarovorans TaxID=3417570 RepID=UPI003D32C34C
MRIAPLLILLTVGCICRAQERQLISANSFTFKSNYNYSISIGEPVIDLLSNGNIKFIQGFIPMKSTAIASDIEQPELSVQIYPNPVTSDIFIKGIDLSKGFSYSIIGTGGTIIEKKKLTQARIHASHLAPGSYIITIFNNKSTYKQKLIKQ